MRTTVDIPDTLLKHLKARAALEGRTLRDLVVDLVEKGLRAQAAFDPQQRLVASPVFGPGQVRPEAGTLKHLNLPTNRGG